MHREFIAAWVISLCFLGCALVNIGYSDVPVTTFTPETGELLAIELESKNYVDSVLVLVKNGELDVSIYAESTSGQTAAVSSTLKGYYKWVTIPVNTQTNRIVFNIESTGAELAEVCLVSASGEKLRVSSIHGVMNPIAGVERLVDEQDKVRLPITAESEAYFDEVYFVRAAEDYLNGRTPYENTHPPLGKEILALGMVAAGYSPFGWRITSALVAAIMLPLVYILGRDVTGNRQIGLIASLLLSLDFMHFTYARIATVDTFVTFFTVLSWVFFLRYYRRRGVEGSQKYKELTLWALSTGLAASTKWYALFALIGQLMLLVIPIGATKDRLNTYTERMLRPTLREASLFLAVCSAVYLSTYLPQVVMGFTLRDIFSQQLQMLTYHATLSATHPFSSPWFSWPLIYRPLWLYTSGQLAGTVSTIVAIGNPVIWWIGLVTIVFGAYSFLRRKSPEYLLITVAFASQWLPYAFLTRPLFIYHYYVEVPILVVSIPLVLKETWGDRMSRYTVFAIVLAALSLFVAFYPAISGIPASSQAIDSLKWFTSWMF
jgi:dolichyl-phosphate-mannose-protein mannosyltransferase